MKNVKNYFLIFLAFLFVVYAILSIFDSSIRTEFFALLKEIMPIVVKSVVASTFT